MTDIRPAQSSDEAELFELAFTFPTPTPPDAAQFAKAFHAKLADASSFLAVADQHGAIVGYVAGYRHPTFYAGGEAAWVDELLVARDFRDHGIGQALMHAFEQWARAHDCRLVGLATAGAAGFYERLGYESMAGYFKKYLRDAP